MKPIIVLCLFLIIIICSKVYDLIAKKTNLQTEDTLRLFMCVKKPKYQYLMEDFTIGKKYMLIEEDQTSYLFKDDKGFETYVQKDNFFKIIIT